MDLVPSLRRDKNLTVEVVETTGADRRAALQLPPPHRSTIPPSAGQPCGAVNQRDFMVAVAGEAGPNVINDHVGYFSPSSPYASDAGMESFSAKPDLAKLKDAVARGRLQGREGGLSLGATDVARISAAICQGRRRHAQQDRPQRRLHLHGLGHRRAAHTAVSNQSPRGGWSILGLMWGGYDCYSPAGDAMLRGNGPNAWAGWPTLPKMGSLRDLQWLHAPEQANSRTLSQETSSCRRSPMCPACLWVSTTNQSRIGTIP